MKPDVIAALCCWILSPPTTPELMRIAPDVHSVEVERDYAVVRSAGVSLKYFGPLQANPLPDEAVHQFAFRIPLHPQAASGRHSRVPIDVAGAFVNGLPVYNQFEALSYNGANLWHYDPIGNQIGNRSRHSAPPGLLEDLVPGNGRHSPLIGFALDGFPIYGPWGYAAGGVRRMRSSYRLRAIAHRHDWPDGTMLTPAQYGPDVSASDPLGTFAEDYEYAAGTGDLDEFNGKWTVTPEYPEGTYAYFLSTGPEGQLAFPYLLAFRLYGSLPGPDAAEFFPIGGKRISLSASSARIEAGHPVRFKLEAGGIRHFEYVHERPIHFLVASADLAEFDHIHPELSPDDSYQVVHTFARGGKYRIWADYSLPGEAPRVEDFDVTVHGPSDARPAAPAPEVKLTLPERLRAGEDIPIGIRVRDAGELRPYLGAWAHVIVIGQELASFAHAHPIEDAVAPGSLHTHAAAGPPPDEIHVMTNFPTAGRYRMWVQFQKAGKVMTAPFDLRVDAGSSTPPTAAIPRDAIRIRVTSHGYEPARVEIPANTAVKLAFTREGAPNCGSEVVFPSAQIRRALPLGETVLIELPPQPAGEIRFACGMGMYRGVLVALRD
jgi:hypothetical protein